MSKRNGDYDDRDHTPVNLGLDEFRYLPTTMQTRVLRSEMTALRGDINGIQRSIRVGGWKMASALIALVIAIGSSLLYGGRILERVDNTSEAVRDLGRKVDRLVETRRATP